MRMRDPSLPLVSVIIPCYNNAAYLPVAVESALGQDYPNIEVIVVNDGSTDETSEVVGRYSEAGVVLIEQANAGISASRNVGILASRGEFVCLLDADDRMDVDLVSSRMLLFEHDRVGIVAGGYRYTDPELTPYPDEAQVPPPAYSVDRRTTLWAAQSPNCGLLVRKRVFVECGYYDPLLKACEDWEQQIRAVQRFEHRFDPVRRSDYRQLPRSLSKNPILMYDSARRALAKSSVYYTDARLMWRWNAAVGMARHSMFQVLIPVWKSADRKKIGSLFLKRPATLFHFLLLIGRSALGRLRRLLGIRG